MKNEKVESPLASRGAQTGVCEVERFCKFTSFRIKLTLENKVMALELVEAGRGESS